MILLGPTRRYCGAPKLLCLFLCLMAGFATPSLAASSAAGTSVPVDPMADITRFVIALPAPAKFDVLTLANPSRIVVEMETGEFLLPPLPKDGPVGLIESFRGGTAGENRSRVIIRVTSPVVIDRSEIVVSEDGKGHQLEIDIASAQSLTPSFEIAAENRSALEAKFSDRMGLGLAPAMIAPPLPRPAESPAVREKRTYKPIIVIDPGHGGHDSGAMKHGVVEKNAVLAFSHVLREHLEATGRYRVRMTRTDDTFVSLDGRREYAEKVGAELFVAVHADYADTNASGATVYSLRQNVANRLKKSTKRHAEQDLGDLSKKASGDMGAVRSILGDLFRREVERTDTRSEVVSRSLVEFMGNSTLLRPNPHKEAAFRVLKTAQFPSVLVELAYVTNRSDAAKLKSSEWRENVASSMVEAIDRYFSMQIARLPL